MEIKKYKVGDKVTISSNLNILKNLDISNTPGINLDMIGYSSLVATITSIHLKDRYRINLDSGNQSWHPYYFDNNYKMKELTKVEDLYIGQYVWHASHPISQKKYIFKIIEIKNLDIITDIYDVYSHNQGRFNFNVINNTIPNLNIPDELENIQMQSFFNKSNVVDNTKTSKLPIPDFFKDNKFKVKKIKYEVSGEGLFTDYCFMIQEKPKLIGLSYKNFKLKKIKFNYLIDFRSLLMVEIKDLLLQWSKPKIISADKSIALFGHKTRKRIMFEESNDLTLKKEFKLTNIIFNFEKDGQYYHVVELFDGTLNLKFLLEEIDLRLPNVNNYILPLDRTKSVGSECKIIKDKTTGSRGKILSSQKGDVVQITEMFNRHKPMFGKRYDKNTVAIVVNKKTGKQFECKLNQLKKIECKEQVIQKELPF